MEYRSSVLLNANLSRQTNGRTDGQTHTTRLWLYIFEHQYLIIFFYLCFIQFLCISFIELKFYSILFFLGNVTIACFVYFFSRSHNEITVNYSLITNALHNVQECDHLKFRNYLTIFSEMSGYYFVIILTVPIKKVIFWVSLLHLGKILLYYKTPFRQQISFWPFPKMFKSNTCIGSLISASLC